MLTTGCGLKFNTLLRKLKIHYDQNQIQIIKIELDIV